MPIPLTALLTSQILQPIKSRDSTGSEEWGHSDYIAVTVVRFGQCRAIFDLFVWCQDQDCNYQYPSTISPCCLTTKTRLLQSLTLPVTLTHTLSPTFQHQGEVLRCLGTWLPAACFIATDSTADFCSSHVPNWSIQFSDRPESTHTRFPKSESISD